MKHPKLLDQYRKFPSKYLPELQTELCGWTILVGRILGPLVMVFELYNMWSMAFVRKDGLNTLPHRVYFTMYILLFSAALVYSVVMWRAHKNGVRKPARILNTAALFCAFHCLWSVAITLYDQRASENVTVYAMAIMSAAIFFYFRPWQSVLLFASAQSILVLLFPTFQPGSINNTGNYINTTIISVVACLMSVVRYTGKCDEVQSHQVISEQNEEIRRINRKLESLARTDELTGLYNRRFLDDLMPRLWNEAAARRQTVAVIMLDIDGFKIFNDTYGHQAGDRCLQTISAVLRSCVSGGRDYLMRYGGEEFAVILIDTSAEEARGKAEKIRHSVEALQIANEHAKPPVVTVSEGVYLSFTRGAQETDGFFRRADDALYRAKREGKNRVVCWREWTEEPESPEISSPESQ